MLRAVAMVAVGSLWVGCEGASAANAMAKPRPVPATQAQAPLAHAGTAPDVAETPKAKAVAQPLAAGQVVHVNAGRVWLGSVPGDSGRDPSREADHVAVDLPAFSIDRLPFPNDPAQPPLTNISRDEATQRCADMGKRLCTELEWERACEGDHESTFAGGSTWDATSCTASRTACDSPLGVSELGLRMREWTASNSEPGIGVSTRTAVTRGASLDAPAADHRCSARNAATPDSRSDSIGFRCCQGELSNVTYPVAPELPAVQELELSTDDLRDKLKGVPELAPFADRFVPLSRTDVTRALARGKRSESSITLWTLTPAVFTWSPVRGEEVIVISGHVDDAVLLAAVYPHDGRWIHGASTLLRDKDSSLAVGIRADDPSALIWTSCWGCYGEGGRLSLGSDGRVSLQFQ